jgi:hypothetical protein
MEAIRNDLASGKVPIDDVSAKISRAASLHKDILSSLRLTSEVIDSATGKPIK